MNRSGVAGIIGVVLVLSLGGVAYVAWASNRVDDEIATREARALEAIENFSTHQDESGPASTAEREAGEASDQGEAAPVEPSPIEPGAVVGINRVPGDDYGRVVVLHADGTRQLLERRCERLHIAAQLGICVSREESFGLATFTARYLDAADTELREVRNFPSQLPSRARVSPSGTLVSTTAFVTGTSYADIGGEAETLAIVDEADASTNLRGLTQFEVLSRDDRYQGVVGEYWGVSFVDEDQFWVTGFFGEEPEVLEGSVSRGVLTPSGLAGSCPSVSPDGSTLVFKRLQDDGEGFDLVAANLDSGTTWLLGESRSVDDQVEWLDDDTILYALHTNSVEEGGAAVAQPQFDIWSLDIAEGSEPQLFLPAADSPAAIRE